MVAESKRRKIRRLENRPPALVYGRGMYEGVGVPPELELKAIGYLFSRLLSFSLIGYIVFISVLPLSFRAISTTII